MNFSFTRNSLVFATSYAYEAYALDTCDSLGQVVEVTA